MTSNNSSDFNKNYGNNLEPSNLLKIISDIKLGWLLTILLLMSIVFYSISFYLDRIAHQQPPPSNSSTIIFISGLLILFASASLASAIIGFGYEWLVRRESGQILSLLLKNNLSEQQKFFSRSLQEIIPNTLLLDRDVQKVLLVAVDKLDEIMRGVLAARLGDSEMGSSLYDGILQKSLDYEERYVDLKHEVVLSNLSSDQPLELRNEFFDVVLNLRYKTKLRQTRFIFARATDPDHFNARIKNPEYIFTWRVRESNTLPKDSNNAVKVLKFKVNGVEIPQEPRLAPDGAFEIVCENSELSELLDKEVTIFYSVQTVLSRLGHVFFSNAIRPTKNVTISFNWARTDIEIVKVYDFFVSAERPTIYQTPPKDPHTAVVEVNEWVFPKGGAVFVWKLKGESNLVVSNINLKELDQQELHQ